MERTDALGRRRSATQNRGLRSLHPQLPTDYRSRLVRVAMSSVRWEQLDALVLQSAEKTTPRALGALIEGWIARDAIVREATTTEAIGAVAAAADWQDWQIRKELALLARTGRGAGTGTPAHVM